MLGFEKNEISAKVNLTLYNYNKQLVKCQNDIDYLKGIMYNDYKEVSMRVVIRINDLKYDFEKLLKQKQLDLEMSNIEFANHIGMHRSWLQKMWSETEPRHPLSEKTMSQLNNRLGISYNDMITYNNQIAKDKKQ